MLDLSNSLLERLKAARYDNQVLSFLYHHAYYHGLYNGWPNGRVDVAWGGELVFTPSDGFGTAVGEPLRGLPSVVLRRVIPVGMARAFLTDADFAAVDEVLARHDPSRGATMREVRGREVLAWLDRYRLPRGMRLEGFSAYSVDSDYHDWCKLLTENPAQFSLLVLANDRNHALARAFVWQTDRGPFLCHTYALPDARAALSAHATAHGWLREDDDDYFVRGNRPRPMGVVAADGTVHEQMPLRVRLATWTFDPPLYCPSVPLSYLNLESGTLGNDASMFHHLTLNMGMGMQPRGLDRYKLVDGRLFDEEWDAFVGAGEEDDDAEAELVAA